MGELLRRRLFCSELVVVLLLSETYDCQAKGLKISRSSLAMLPGTSCIFSSPSLQDQVDMLQDELAAKKAAESALYKEVAKFKQESRDAKEKLEVAIAKGKAGGAGRKKSFEDEEKVKEEAKVSTNEKPSRIDCGRFAGEQNTHPGEVVLRASRTYRDRTIRSMGCSRGPRRPGYVCLGAPAGTVQCRVLRRRATSLLR